jgi:hypothetical protein
MKKFFKKNLYLVALLTILILPTLIFAGNNFASAEGETTPNPLIKNLDTVAGENGAGFAKADKTSVSTIIGTVVNVALGFLGIIFVCLIIYAGFVWMTAQGEEAKVSKAQTIIKNCIIGLIVLTSAWAIYNIIAIRFL